jgi:hypothetical protein
VLSWGRCEKRDAAQHIAWHAGHRFPNSFPQLPPVKSVQLGCTAVLHRLWWHHGGQAVQVHLDKAVGECQQHGMLLAFPNGFAQVDLHGLPTQAVPRMAAGVMQTWA